ncbi:MAG TPA: NUDIX domain-containing protein [Magnetospirillaceae bacterium]|nr:NUDIX domain-containing protein [Magnetospirillaceae bacterium]
MQHASTTYRVTAKAIINDAAGQVLLVEETGGHRSLPGGGIEHGEDPEAGLARELHEELGISVIHLIKLKSAYPYYSVTRQAWWLWLLYEVDADLPAPFVGEHAQTAQFFDIATFKHSVQKSEQRLYEVFKALP